MKGVYRFPARLRSIAIAAPLALLLVTWPGDTQCRADELSEIAFTEGLVALKSDDLPTAIERLETAVSRDPQDAPAWYWLGIARSRSGDDAAAIDAYDHALGIDPDYAQALYARGNALSRQGKQSEARDDWSLVDENVPGSGLAENARLRLEQRDGAAQEKDWDLTVGIGAEYDTNVFLYPNLGDAPLEMRNGRLVPYRPPDHRHDTRFRYYLNGGYRLLQSGNWRLSTRQFFQASTQVRSEDVNFIEYSPSFSIDYDTGSLTYGLDYIFSLTGLGGDQFYLRNSVQPRVTLREGDNFYTRLYYRYSHSDYDTGGSREFDRGGNEHRVGLDQFALVFDERGYARLGVEWRRDLTDGTEYEGSFFTVSGELVAPLPADAQLNLSAGQTWGNYDNESAFSRPSFVFFVQGPTFNRTVTPVRVGDPKSERTTTGSVVVSRQFGEHWGSSAGYSFTVNQSSIDAFDYNRSIFSFFMNYTF